jgi:hypothetical protein
MTYRPFCCLLLISIAAFALQAQAEAQKAGAVGEVKVQIVFDEDGKVIWARATSGHLLLRAACEDAPWQSTFPPLKVSGRPEKVMGFLLYNFAK